MLYFALVWSIGSDFNFASGVSYTSWTMPFGPRWVIGGVFLIALVSAVLGLVIMVAWWLARPPSSRARCSAARRPPGARRGRDSGHKPATAAA